MRWKDNRSSIPEEFVQAFLAGNPGSHRADEDEADCGKGEEDVPGVFLERHCNKFGLFLRWRCVASGSGLTHEHANLSRGVVCFRQCMLVKWEGINH